MAIIGMPNPSSVTNHTSSVSAQGLTEAIDTAGNVDLVGHAHKTITELGAALKLPPPLAQQRLAQLFRDGNLVDELNEKIGEVVGSGLGSEIGAVVGAEYAKRLNLPPQLGEHLGRQIGRDVGERIGNAIGGSLIT